MSNNSTHTPATATTIDPRYDNFVQAYLDLGYEQDEAQYRGAQRFKEDLDTHFPLYACTNFSTAKATVWLLEAASMLCCGSLGNAEAIRLIEMAKEEVNRG